MYSLADIPVDVVAYGSRVTLENVETGDRERYQIVLPEEVDAAKGDISLRSPLGQAIMKKGVGDEVEVHSPRGKRCYEIVEVQTIHDTLATSEK